MNRGVDPFKYMVATLGLPIKVFKEDYKWENSKIEKVAEDILYQMEFIQTDEEFSFKDYVDTLEDEVKLSIDKIFKETITSNTAEDISMINFFGLPVLALFDKNSFSEEDCVDFVVKLRRYYDHWKRGFISTYDLRRLIKETTGMTITRN